MEFDKKSVGKRIKRIRLSLGYTQADFSEVLKVSRVAIHNWEEGKVKPTPKTLADIAFYGQISVAELLEGDVIKVKPIELFFHPTDIRQYLSAGMSDEDIEGLAYELSTDYETISTVLERANIYVNMTELPETITVRKFEEEI